MHNEKGDNLDKNWHDAVIIAKIRLKFQKTGLYRVFFLNNGYTLLRNFIIFVLKPFLKIEEAAHIM
ncbi:ATP-dependent Clp protease adapter protein ClpS [Bartonella callosciuri]|uniref:ATP-dependent Clp protease adapter protein ClpS n=1 Tax=Bartonella callosciuri TaxID=686223 RepID=A0A840NR67_9HYPH|nr:ATP-dependent Clp protease adapter protein ClpS [Bartonella callosciuri]